MNSTDFESAIRAIRTASIDTLATKNAKYSKGCDDRLHNFKAGASISGGTPAQAAWGYMVKHLVALRDKIEKDDFSDADDLLEKCQDVINYTIFIYIIGMEQHEATERKKASEVSSADK